MNLGYNLTHTRTQNDARKWPQRGAKTTFYSWLGMVARVTGLSGLLRRLRGK